MVSGASVSLKNRTLADSSPSPGVQVPRLETKQKHGKGMTRTYKEGAGTSRLRIPIISFLSRGAKCLSCSMRGTMNSKQRTRTM